MDRDGTRHRDGADSRRGGGGGHQPRPRRPAHRRRRTHRPVHHRRVLEQRVLEGIGAGPPSRREWRLPTPTAPNASSSRSLSSARKASALADIAVGGWRATDPDRAARLIADAERIAQSINDADSAQLINVDGQKASALAAIAAAVAVERPRPRRTAHRRRRTHRPAPHRRVPRKASDAGPISRRWWRSPTPTAPNASPSPSPAKARGHRRWSTSRLRWRLATAIRRRPAQCRRGPPHIAKVNRPAS